MTDSNIETKAEATAEGMSKIVAALRDNVQKYTEESVEYKSTVENIQKDFDKFIKENEELKSKVHEQKTEAEKQKEVISALERHVAVNKVGAITTKSAIDKDLTYVFEKMIGCDKQMFDAAKCDKKYIEAITNICSKDTKLTPSQASATRFILSKENKGINEHAFELEKKYIRTDIDDLGGYLVPPEFSLTILKRGTEYSPIRQHSNVMTTYSNLLYLPVRNVLTAAFMEWEQVPSIDANSKSQSQYVREGIYMKRMGVKTQVSHEMILYSPFDIQALVSNDVVERFTQAEGNLFINGGGTTSSPNQVEGILSNPNVIAYNSAVSTLNADDVLNMQASIKWAVVGGTEYDRTYILNKRTLINLLTKKSGTGIYLWNTGALGGGYPDTIGGYPYVVAADMPDIGSGNTPVVMGDLKRAYTIVDRLSLYMIRDDVTDPPNVNLSFFKYFGAKVVLPEALVKLVLA
jgi:HK97 family phage major capsid protein